MIRAAWGNLTDFGRAITLVVVVGVMGYALIAGMAFRDYAAAAPETPVETPRPIVLATSIVSLTTAPPVEEPTPAREIDRPAWLTAAEVRAIARDVSGSPIWAAWAATCWSKESGRGPLFEVGAVSPTNPDGSHDWGVPQINDRAWPTLDGPRAAADPVYAIRFAWEVVWPEQGKNAWNAEGCRV